MSFDAAIARKNFSPLLSSWSLFCYRSHVTYISFPISSLSVFVRDCNIFVLYFFLISVFLHQHIFQHETFNRLYLLLSNMSPVDFYSIPIFLCYSIFFISRDYPSKRPFSLPSFFRPIFCTLPHILLFQVFSYHIIFAPAHPLFKVSLQSIFRLTQFFLNRAHSFQFFSPPTIFSPSVSILFSSIFSYRIS